jgi:Lipopolysaccharide-assembly
MGVKGVKGAKGKYKMKSFRPFFPFALFIPFAPFALLCPGCGYEADSNTTIAGYQWKTLYRTDVRTVAVPIFITKDFHRGIEFQVSDALVHSIEAFTPYKVVSRDHADTIIEGEVVSVKTNYLSLSSTTGTPQEQLATIVVNFTWKDLRTGKILVDRKNFSQAATYYPTLGEGELAGEQNAAEKMSQAIVHELEAAW